IWRHIEEKYMKEMHNRNTNPDIPFNRQTYFNLPKLEFGLMKFVIRYSTIISRMHSIRSQKFENDFRQKLNALKENFRLKWKNQLNKEKFETLLNEEEIQFTYEWEQKYLY